MRFATTSTFRFILSTAPNYTDVHSCEGLAADELLVDSLESLLRLEELLTRSYHLLAHDFGLETQVITLSVELRLDVDGAVSHLVICASVDAQLLHCELVDEILERFTGINRAAQLSAS